MKTTPGKIDILNCSKGHAEVHIDAADPIALARSARIIEDMLRRGYALFIAGADGALIRVEKFNPETKCYIIGVGPLYAGEVPPAQEPGEVAKPPGKRDYRRQKTREVPIAAAHTTAIPRTAGG